MARPTKIPADQLTRRGNFRLTEAEGQQLDHDAAAAGQSVSDYVRGLVVRAKPRRVQASPERRAIIASLGQLGNIRADINQLVKDRQAHSFVRPEDVSAALSSITRLADELIKLSGDGD